MCTLAGFGGKPDCRGSLFVSQTPFSPFPVSVVGGHVQTSLVKKKHAQHIGMCTLVGLRWGGCMQRAFVCDETPLPGPLSFFLQSHSMSTLKALGTEKQTTRWVA